MTNHLPERQKILFLFSDTGGGHRSAAEAIIEALENHFVDKVSAKMVDIFHEYAPPPLHQLPAIYPKVVRVPQAWGLGYRLSNGHRRARLITSSMWPYVRNSARQLVLQHPSDLVVSVHPLANAPILSALGKNRPPFVTVVTDLVTTHALWYHHRSDLCLVPTQPAFERAIQSGMDPEKVVVVGLPVAQRFCQPISDPIELRRYFGWPIDLPVILLVGGGDGMGPLERTAYALAESGLKVCLVVVAGRNQGLKTSLEAREWPIPVFIYGFVREMPQFMHAADILVTKAGPGTITEAFNAGLPLILYSRLPGQEDGNVYYVVREGAGVWSPTPDLIVSTVKSWIENPEKRKLASDASRRLARPQAALQIAQILVNQIGIKARP
jgi:1,2-diacylglycerol 3-beta-galactosyltransferase